MALRNKCAVTNGEAKSADKRPNTLVILASGMDTVSSSKLNSRPNALPQRDQSVNLSLLQACVPKIKIMARRKE